MRRGGETREGKDVCPDGLLFRNSNEYPSNAIRFIYLTLTHSTDDCIILLKKKKFNFLCSVSFQGKTKKKTFHDDQSIFGCLINAY